MIRGRVTRTAAVLVAAALVSGCASRPAFRVPMRPEPGRPPVPLAGPSPSSPAPGPLGPVPSPGASDAELVQRLESIAESWVGTPYRRGGQDEQGIDCSALARTVLSELGVSLPRTTSDQRRVGHTVPRDEVAPGDLVFFRLGSRRVNHVGVALDSDRFLHASSTRGVVVETLQGSYFGRRFAEARRVSGG